MPAFSRPVLPASAVFAALAGLTGAAAAQTAAPPRACSSTTPANLTTTSRSSPVSAVLSENPTTLWVLYGDREPRGQDTVALMEVGGIATRSLAVSLHAIGDGTVTAGALTIVGGNVVAAYVRPDHHIGIYAHPLSGAADRRSEFDAPHVPSGLSMTTVGERALAGWDDGPGGVRFAWLDGTGTPAGAVRTLPGRYGPPMVTSAFGGAVLLENRARGPARLGVLLATPTSRLTVAPAAARVPAIAAISTARVNDRALVLSTSRGHAHLTVLNAATGAGSDRDIGMASPGSETSLVATAWGALAAWTDGGAVRVLPVTPAGIGVSASFTVSDSSTGERPRTPALVVAGDSAFVLWSGTGLPGANGSRNGNAVRMVRLTCM